jgi:hypothetical protein
MDWLREHYVLMAHFAQLNEQNIVTQVIAVADDELLVDGVEDEAKGVAFCQSLFGGDWKQTSYSGSIRKNYAGLGYTYDAKRDAFIPPQPYPSWVLVEETCNWIAPVSYPTNGGIYQWNETTAAWVEFIKENQ